MTGPHIRLRGALAAAAAATALSIAPCACTSAQEQSADRQVQGAFDDGAVYSQIEAKFATIDPDSTLHVAVAVHDGAVKLTGRARSQATIEKFEAAARSIHGVTSVSARIALAPGLPNTGDQAKDVALSAAVFANLAGQTGLNAASVNVSANRGVVTLKGHAKTRAIAATLVNAAKTTAGVRRVDDRLTIDGT